MTDDGRRTVFVNVFHRGMPWPRPTTIVATTNENETSAIPAASQSQSVISAGSAHLGIQPSPDRRNRGVLQDSSPAQAFHPLPPLADNIGVASGHIDAGTLRTLNGRPDSSGSVADPRAPRNFANDAAN